MTAPRLVSRATKLRRTSRLVARFDQAFAAMSANRFTFGLALVRFGRSATAGPIPAAVATIIINNQSVGPANDGLFPDLLAQTWRMK